MIFLLLAMVNLASASFEGQSVAYQEMELWTGGNMYSSSPGPACPCDRDPNKMDCPTEFVTETFQGEVCYDEFIPGGSRGWVHARVFGRVELGQ